MAKQLELVGLYKNIVNTLAGWKFADWPKDLVGCASLLHGENRRLFPYILPITKVFNWYGAGQQVALFSGALQEAKLPNTLWEKYEEWLDKCPFIKEDNTQFQFYTGTAFIYPTRVFLQGNYRIFRGRSIRAKGSSEWGVIHKLVDLFGQPGIKWVEEGTGKNKAILFYLGTLDAARAYKKAMENVSSKYHRVTANKYIIQPPE